MTDHPNPRPGAARPTIDPAVSTARPTTGPRAGEPRTAADPRTSEARPAETFTTARTGDSRSVPELLADLARSVPNLVRQEVQLLRSEMSDKITQVEIGLGSIVAGALLLFAALLILLQAIVIALTEFVGPGWAALIVGVAVAAIGAVLLKKGADQMKVSNLMPERTTNQLKQDRDLAKEQAR
jgi:uncharacterized membrane protein YqjE